MDSTPPVSTIRASPASIAREPWTTASTLDAHNRFTVVPVTVVDQDIVTIGRAAGARLLQQIKSTNAVGEELILKPTLKVRQSCGCGRIKGFAGR